MRGTFSRARTATLLTLFLCCSLLLTGCGSTHAIFALINKGEYEKAHEIFLEFPEKNYEKLTEEAEKYIESTAAKFSEGEITMEVALQRFGTVRNFGISSLDRSLDNAAKEILDTYTKNVLSSPDKIDLQKEMETYDSLNNIYPFRRMYTNPIDSAREDVVQTYVATEIAKVYNGTLDFEDFCSNVSVIQGDMLLYSLAQEAIDEYEYVLFLDDAYNTGKEYFENGNYPQAIELLSCIPDTDSRYNEITDLIISAQNKISENKMVEAQKYADSHYYDQAIEILNNLLDSGYDYIAVSDKIAEYEAAKADYLLLTEFEQIATEARLAAEKGDYNTALTSIMDYADECYYTASDTVWNEIVEVFNEIEAPYIAMISNKVETLYKNGDYLSAIAILDNTIIEDQHFEELRAMIEAEKPTYLCEMGNVLVNNDRYSQVTDRIATDTIGNKYESENVFCINPYYDGYAQYYLGYQYDTLTGIIAPCNTSKNYVATFKIIGDDKVLYEIEMSRTTTPTILELDVSSVNFIKFEVEAISSNWGDTINPLLIDFAFTKSKA